MYLHGIARQRMSPTRKECNSLWFIELRCITNTWYITCDKGRKRRKNEYKHYNCTTTTQTDLTIQVYHCDHSEKKGGASLKCMLSFFANFGDFEKPGGLPKPSACPKFLKSITPDAGTQEVSRQWSHPKWRPRGMAVLYIVRRHGNGGQSVPLSQCSHPAGGLRGMAVPQKEGDHGLGGRSVPLCWWMRPVGHLERMVVP